MSIRDRLIVDFKTLIRFWSVQWAAIGTFLLPIMTIVPSMPWEIQQLLPPRVRVVVTSLWCVMFIILRWTQQRKHHGC